MIIIILFILLIHLLLFVLFLLLFDWVCWFQEKKKPRQEIKGNDFALLAASREGVLILIQYTLDFSSQLPRDTLMVMMMMSVDEQG